MGEHDSVIFFNFRPDRAREITRSLVDPEFHEFETKPLLKNKEFDEGLIANIRKQFVKEVGKLLE